MDRPFIATVQVAGPFDVSTSPLWIKAKAEGSGITGENISSVGTDSSDVKPEEEQISRGRRAMLVIGIVAAIAVVLIIGRKKTTV